MNLPIEPSPMIEKRLHMALAYALTQRQQHGKELAPVTLTADGPRNYLGISDLAQPPCALFYKLTGAEKEETDTGTRFGFDTGHILESYVLDLLSVGPNYRQREVSFDYDLAPGGKVLGHLDGLAINLFPGIKVVIESKATGGYSFGKKIEEGPDQNHIEQAFCYAVGSNTPYFTVIYCNREAKKSTPFYLVRAYRITDLQKARNTVDELFSRFALVLYGIDAGQRPACPTAPKFEFGPRGWRCRPDKTYFARGKGNRQVGYCGYRQTCPEGQHYQQQEEERQAPKQANG